MRIRNRGNPLSPPPDISPVLQTPPSPPPPPPSKPSFSAPQSDQPPPHVMVSRINARLSSVDNGSDSKDTFSTTSAPFAQDESITDDSWSMCTNESFGHSIFGQTSTSSNSVSSSLSYNGRWCEEERAIPLKKRRVMMVSYETKLSKETMEKDALMEERNQNQKCNRVNGKGWSCNRMRVKGHSLCNHHLEMQRMRNTNCPSSRNQGEEKGTTSFAVSSNGGRGNQIRENKRDKVVKARSISSLLRDTVPLFY